MLSGHVPPAESERLLLSGQEPADPLAGCSPHETGIPEAPCQQLPAEPPQPPVEPLQPPAEPPQSPAEPPGPEQIPPQCAELASSVPVSCGLNVVVAEVIPKCSGEVSGEFQVLFDGVVLLPVVTAVHEVT